MRRAGADGRLRLVAAGRAVAASARRVSFDTVVARLLSDPRVFGVAVAAVAGGAVALRSVSLMQDGLNSDEAVYAGQAAALSGDHVDAALFGVFRAHPLLAQFLVSLVYRVTGVGDVAPRVFAVVVGLVLACVVAALTWTRVGRRGALLAFAMVALSPYCITVSRQFLLDGPLALAAAGTLLLLVRYLRTGRPGLLYAAAVVAGCAVLVKEPGVLLLPAMAIAVWSGRDAVGLRVRHVAVALAVYALAILPMPLSLLAAGGGNTAHQFVVWQIFRRANHDAVFYLVQVVPAVGVPTALLALAGLIVALRRRRPEDTAVACFLIVPLVFFELWPVKGFQYLLVVVPPFTVLAVEGLFALGRVGAVLLRPLLGGTVRSRSTAVVVLLSAVTFAVLGAGASGPITASGAALAATDSGDDAAGTTVSAAATYVAGTGGLRGGREVGHWIATHTDADATFVTIGPTFANVVQFYGRRRALALSVSPNPLHRNPSYEPMVNPDLLVRSGSVQYLVYDAYSAGRTAFFAQKLIALARRYHGEVVYAAGASDQPIVDWVPRAPVIVFAVYP